VLQEPFHVKKPVGYISCISMAEKNDWECSIQREKPAVEFLSILGVEIDFFMVQLHTLRREVKSALRKEDKEVLNLWVKDVKSDPQNEDQRNQIWPLDWHKEYSADFFVEIFQDNN
jgi:hypothetical protein